MGRKTRDDYLEEAATLRAKLEMAEATSDNASKAANERVDAALKQKRENDHTLKMVIHGLQVSLDRARGYIERVRETEATPERRQGADRRSQDFAAAAPSETERFARHDPRFD